MVYKLKLVYVREGFVSISASMHVESVGVHIKGTISLFAHSLFHNELHCLDISRELSARSDKTPIIDH